MKYKQKGTLDKKFDGKAFSADTLAMIIYSTPIAMGIELGFMGMTISESFSSRGTVLPVNLLNLGHCLLIT